jgi:hypothetical protein
MLLMFPEQIFDIVLIVDGFYGIHEFHERFQVFDEMHQNIKQNLQNPQTGKMVCLTGPYF